MQERAHRQAYTLAELLEAATPYRHGAHSPLESQPFILADLTPPTALSAAEQIALHGWLQRQPCPTLAIAPPEHPLARAFDVLLPTANENGSAANREIDRIIANIKRTPLAAMVLVQVLRNTESMPAASALLVESLAYATLQTGSEFKQWLSTQSAPLTMPVNTEPPLLIERDGDVLTLRLNRPERRNAISVEVRDALYETLQLVLSDASIQRVDISGNGACFSTGGDVDEFGSVVDGISAHTIRSLRLPANLLVLCGERLHVHVHSACIGAGIEIPAFGRRITATRNAFFQLPELQFGLIPGAGGCISLPRRIGRQRTAYMALSMKKINAPTALEWGLIDAIMDK
jgi:enoyl-CoA hydratase/isomerase-like protein